VVAQGPFVSAQNFADPSVTALAYNQSAAKALLDSLGWTPGKDNIRRKNGRPLRLEILVPTSSSLRQAASVILQEQFNTLGVKLEIEIMENNALGERVFGSRKWDGVFMGYHPEPGSSGVRGNWGSSNATMGGSNVALYKNVAFDAHLDSAQTSYDANEAREHFRDAFTVLNGDAPAIFLYELRGSIGVHNRIEPAYLRPDAWWSHLDEWSIPAEKRIARDRIGLGKEAAAR
jgi:ABC-type transport system substrate-binding protein